MDRIKYFFQKWGSPFLTYTSSERIGIIVLSILIILCILFLQFIPRIFSSETTFNPEQWKEVEALISAMKEVNEQKSVITEISQSNLNNERSISYFPFNPNTISREGWLKLGLEKWQIDIIKNYIKKGGSFEVKKDLQNIYGIADSTYFMLEPYILLPEKKQEKQKPLRIKLFDPNTVTSNELADMGFQENLIHSLVNYRNSGGHFYTKNDVQKLYGLNDSLYHLIEDSISLPSQISNAVVEKVIYRKVEINSADTLDLQQLMGIGPSFANKIVKYRNLLGGYHSINQLLEVYGMDSSRFVSFYEQVEIDTSLIKKININDAGIKEMIRHPYIEFYMAKAIVVKRESQQGFKRVGELLEMEEFYPELYQKLSPYLYAGNINLSSDQKRKKKVR